MYYTGPILLTGDQIASVSNATNQGNPGDAQFGMVLDNVTALAGPDTVYRLVWSGNNNPGNTDTFFRNGQFWTLERYSGTGDPRADTAHWAQVPGLNRLGPRNDLVAGLGAADEYIVLNIEGGGFLFYDTRGNLPATPTRQVIPASDQNAYTNPDNTPGELNFAAADRAFPPICFCTGTLIATDCGPVKIEDLAKGDLVLTRDNGLQPIRWIGCKTVSLARTAVYPQLLPVRIAAGAMGPDLPQRDLWVSPQHRLLVSSPIVARMAGQAEALVAAKQLCATPGITQIATPQQVTYVHLRLDRHDLVCAEGVWAETLLLGPQALRSMGPAARHELALIFDDLVENLHDAARPVVAGRQARRLAQRHVAQDKALLACV